LGVQIYSSNGGETGAIAQQVLRNGEELVFENFTILSRNGGRDLVGPLKQILGLAEEHGAKMLTFRGTFSNPDLAARFGKAAGDEFSFTTPATLDLQALKEVPK
jgi:hypothetical protein